MVQAYPDARVLTTLVDPERLPERLRRAEPSFLQHVPRPRVTTSGSYPRCHSRGARVGRSQTSRCRLEQPRMRQGRPDRCRHPPPLLLLHAHALCLGLRVGEAAVPDGCATRGPPTRNLVSSLGSGDRRQGGRVRCHLDGRRRANRTLLWPFGAGDLPTGSDRPVHARRGALGRVLYVGRLVGYKRPDLVVDAWQDCGSACGWSARDACFPSATARNTQRDVPRARRQTKAARPLPNGQGSRLPG